MIPISFLWSKETKEMIHYKYFDGSRKVLYIGDPNNQVVDIDNTKFHKLNDRICARVNLDRIFYFSTPDFRVYKIDHYKKESTLMIKCLQFTEEEFNSYSYDGIKKKFNSKLAKRSLLEPGESL